jgi:hypothetical protein
MLPLLTHARRGQTACRSRDSGEREPAARDRTLCPPVGQPRRWKRREWHRVPNPCSLAFAMATMTSTSHPSGVTEGFLKRFSIVGGLLLLVPVGATAQGGELPTLAGAGLEYVSGSGFFQVSLSGQLDLEGLVVGEDRWAGLVGGSSTDSVPSDWPTACASCHGQEMVHPHGKSGPIMAHRLRVFADVFLGDHLYGLVEARSDRGEAPSNHDPQVRFEQAYVRASTTSGAFGVQVGKFASPVGSYSLRHLTDLDPFLRPPLAYDYRTVMSRTHVPPDAQGFLSWKRWPELFRLSGTPPIWDVPYQWGAMVFGSLGIVDLRAAAVNSAPSSDPEAWGFAWKRFEHPSWTFGARAQVSPSLQLGASYDRGPWMEGIEVGTLNASGPGSARSFWDFDQEMVSTDFAFARGPMMLRGEAILDLWSVPNVAGRPKELLYTAELQWDVSAGLSAAARAGYIDFRPLSGGGGGAAGGGAPAWDNDVYRLEASLGYRLVRNAGVTISAYRQTSGDVHTLFAGTRLWWAF